MDLILFREVKWLDLAYLECLVMFVGQVWQNLLDVKEMYHARRKGIHGRQHGKMMEMMGKHLG